MISTSSSLSSSVNFFGPKVVILNGRASSPRSLQFRSTPRISASCASTAERTASHISLISPSASLYEVLGIPMGATCQEIKSAYRRLAREVHPDVVANGQRSQTSAGEFIKVHEAYATLSDPDRRADYDRLLCGVRQTASYPMAASRHRATMASRFAGHSRRTWETDQCW
ncbi:Chaperone protein dnaJ 11, chloroplastic [Morella rubra]|uniref:Chaperone protein dnaJ 11, chloroplastic n=1 Tax=Morella rubra TaxID=262757 RepID=A0A6A1UTR2_9ROSI|nr:Chaperone protein dnaJ 11, chloroplastic [Morella rubra]